MIAMNSSKRSLSSAVNGSKKQNILLFAEFGRTGGTRTFFLQLLDFYEALGFSVDIVSFFEPDEEVKERCQRANFTITHFNSYGSNYGSYGDFPFYLKKEADFFRFHVEQVSPDIVVSTVGTPGLFLGVHHLKIPGIYILHTYPTTKRKAFLRWFRSKMIRLFAPREVCYVSVSEYSKQALIKVWGLSSRTHNLRVLPNTNGPVSPKVKPPSGPCKILTVGHVIDYKSPLTWIQVAEKVCQIVPEATFTWLGDGPDIAFCREVVFKSGLQDRIQFTGDVKNVAPYYDEAHVYLQLSLIENSPFAVLEAMRRGIPCVLSDVGGLRELSQGGSTAITVPWDTPNKAVEEVLGLLDSEVKRKKYGQASRRAYNRNHHPETWASQMQSLHDVTKSKVPFMDGRGRQAKRPI